MKKIIFLAVAMFMFNFMNAQNKVVKVNPLGIVFGVFNGTYEQALNEKNSFTIGASYFSWGSLNFTGFGAEAGYRFYFSKTNEAPEGMYFAPYAGVNSYSYTGSSSVTKGMAFGGGVQGGYQWILDSGLAMDLYFGYGFYTGGVSGVSTGTGGVPKLGFAIGYAFD